MTPLERKKKQYQLDALRARKARADSLGPEVIARTRVKYDTICAQISQLENELAADLGGPIEELARILHEALAWDWPRKDPWALCRAVQPSITDEIARIEQDMTAAHNQNQTARFMELIPQYRAALQEMHRVTSQPPAQTDLFAQFEEVDNVDDIPWKRRPA